MRWLVACALLLAGAANAQDYGITKASYTDPTTRYAHAILGDAIEYGAMEITRTDGKRFRIILPQDRVFEDVAPRVVDLDGDGLNEVIVVETQVDTGAQLAVYGATGKITGTPHIGRTNRWLAPIGAADLDGDGRTEIAYIDRPHLAKTLMIWRYEDQSLTLVAKREGLTNHRIGEADIAGGIRTCTGTPEMITATANWSQIVATTYQNGQLNARAIGPHQGRRSFRQALACQF